MLSVIAVTRLARNLYVASEDHARISRKTKFSNFSNIYLTCKSIQAKVEGVLLYKNAYISWYI